MGTPDIRADELRKARNYVHGFLSPLKNELDWLVEHVRHMETSDLDHLHGLIETFKLKALRAELQTVHVDCPLDDDGTNGEHHESSRGFWQSLRDTFSQ